MTELEGHLFIAHGKIESVIHDAALIPVGQEYRFSPLWTSLVGDNPPRPDRWAERGFGRIKPAPDRVWAVSVGGQVADDYAVILDRVVGALGRVDKFRDSHPLRRKDSLPLVAVNVIGIGRGGYAGDRGAVLRKLVARLAQAARDLRLDVVLTTPDPAVYAAAQYARRGITQKLPGRLEDMAVDLGRQAREGRLALLIGAGVSAAAGLPGWDQLIEELAKEFGVVEPSQLNQLTPTDRAELIERLSHGKFQAAIARQIKVAERPSLMHALLAGLDCREVVTTNYDLLYEGAVRATGREVTSVMPWQSAHGADRWILKLHGDVQNEKTIVLTRRHMVRYDAANRPSASVLQSLLLTRHLLAVGVSMTDDNVIRLAHEVQEYRTHHQKGDSGTFGTVIDSAGNDLRRQLWDGQLDWASYEAGGKHPHRRGAELLLDRIAMHAARDSSWLLDERFDGLLRDDHEREVARDVREMYRRIPKRAGNKWWPLIQSLERFGASSGDHPLAPREEEWRRD